jgi:hypothetical protein
LHRPWCSLDANRTQIAQPPVQLATDMSINLFRKKVVANACCRVQLITKFDIQNITLDSNVGIY